MAITYGPGKIRCTVHWMHTTMQCYQSALAYSAMPVRYILWN